MSGLRVGQDKIKAVFFQFQDEAGYGSFGIWGVWSARFLVHEESQTNGFSILAEVALGVTKRTDHGLNRIALVMVLTAKSFNESVFICVHPWLRGCHHGNDSITSSS